MKIEVEAVSPVEKKVTVEVESEHVARELETAYRAIGQRVKLRGFRPGKIPRNVLERHFREEVERDVVQKLVNSGFADAVKERKLQAVGQPRVDVAEEGLKPAQAFRFTATVEVKPDLDPQGYEGLEVQRQVAEVTDQMISDELTRIQEGMSQLVPVEGRFEAQEGDYAVIDHEGWVEGKPFEGGSARGITVKVGPGEITDGTIPQLVGKKLEESVEFDQAFPADHSAEALRGKMSHMKVTLKGLKVRQVPALDDELAKDLGIEGVDTLDKLRARLREELGKREARRAEVALRDALVKAALAKNEFEAPGALVERAIDAMIGGAGERFARQGLDIRKMGLDLPRLRAELREQALIQVKGALLLEAIADREKLEVSEEEVEAEVSKTATDLNLPLAKVQQQFRSDESRTALRNRVREDKAIALLTSRAKIN